MAKVIFGNHSAVRVPRTEKDRIRQFYRDVLGCKIMRESDQKDDFRMGENFYFAFLYESEEVALDESQFLKAIYLELKADNVEDMRQKIVAFGVKVLEVPDPHLYFQAPGGQVFRLVGINEDLAKYEGTEHGEQFVGSGFEVSGGDQNSPRGRGLVPQELSGPRAWSWMKLSNRACCLSSAAMVPGAKSAVWVSAAGMSASTPVIPDTIAAASAAPSRLRSGPLMTTSLTSPSAISCEQPRPASIRSLQRRPSVRKPAQDR